MIIKLETNDIKECLDDNIKNQIERIVKSKVNTEINKVIDKVISEKFNKEEFDKIVYKRLESKIFTYYGTQEIKQTASKMLSDKIDVDKFLDEDFKKEIVDMLNKKIKFVRFDM